MARTRTATLRLSAIAAVFALGAGLFTAPLAVAGERGDRWERDRSYRVERRYDGDRDYRRDRRRDRDYRHDRRWDRKADKRHETARKRYRRGHDHEYRPKHRRHAHRHYVKKKDDWVGPAIVGIGLGVLTYAILNDSHGHGH